MTVAKLAPNVGMAFNGYISDVFRLSPPYVKIRRNRTYEFLSHRNRNYGSELQQQIVQFKN